jgi:hypothetical protein
MSTVLPELRSLSTGLVLDGELVAWKGIEPHFPLICRLILNRDMSIALTFIVFDLLRLDGTDVTQRRTPSAVRSSRTSISTPTGGGRETRFQTAMRSSWPCARWGSRESLRRSARASTAQTVAAG